MNRFRQKKKAKEDSPPDRFPFEPESSGPFKMFGKAKKSQDEPKREVDLTSALPPSDDFRTSLLMTGLSARFSMLREQDDPSSILGKASDDSVLLPSKRQSRLDFAMSNNLGDIAEVESIHAPASARLGSFNSFDEGSSAHGSIMNRSKPIETNNLFGGRQRIYKINANGVTRGRALCDDDVAQSAFQKWRQAEKEKMREREQSSFEQNDNEADTASLRPESPASNDFNRRRETSSTTSSIAARDSTAATSVASSQPAPSPKDWNPPSLSATPPASIQERTVSRTRRLYEQGLNKDLQDQQSSALSRMNTLSKKPSFPRHTSDFTTDSPSPTLPGGILGERSVDRRPVMTKGSAPNLRSFSPTTNNSSQLTPAETSPRIPGSERKSSQVALPPSSPPINEAEEHPILSIGPNDRGKATAMGVFQRPQQYDDTKFAQRQRQLQRGRDVSATRVRTGSNDSAPTSRSGSSSSLNRRPLERADLGAAKFEPAANEESSAQPAVTPANASTQVSVERPSNEGRPASKKGNVPAPLTLSKSTNDVPSRLEGPLSAVKNHTSDDSPTLGSGSCLSGMVRQHLRSDSNASSLYGAAPQGSEPDVYHDNHVATNNTNEPLNTSTDQWGNRNAAWNSSPKNESSVHQAEIYFAKSPYKVEPAADENQHQVEVAHHLSEGAQRLRERLTSYAGSDQSSASSPAQHHGDSRGDPGSYHSHAPYASRPRSSKGSSITTSPVQEKPSAEVHEALENKDSFQARPAASEHSSPDEVEENVPAGLKAFRQARRELQKMRETEARQRHRSPQNSIQPPTGRRPAPQGRAPPPVSYNRVPSDEAGVPGYASRPGSRSNSRPGSRSGSRSQRDRSESAASNGAPPHTRPNRIPRDEHRGPQSPSAGPRPTASGSPGFPGPDHRHQVRTPAHNAPPPPSLQQDFSSGGPSPGMDANAPPLPPINPRRKNVGSPSLRRPDDDKPPSPHWSNNQGRGTGSSGTFLQLDGEGAQGQFHPRARTTNMDAGNRGPVARSAPKSPSYAPPRPPVSGSVGLGNSVPPSRMV